MSLGRSPADFLLCPFSFVTEHNQLLGAQITICGKVDKANPWYVDSRSGCRVLALRCGTNLRSQLVATKWHSSAKTNSEKWNFKLPLIQTFLNRKSLALTTCGNIVTLPRKNKLWKIKSQTISYTNIFEKESHLATKRHFSQNLNFESNKKTNWGQN